MRRLILAAVAVLVLAVPAAANAFFTPRFDVIGHGVEGHDTQAGGFAFKDNLLDPADPDNSVGHDRGRCTPRSHEVLHCRAVGTFNGELGGQGTINIKGNITHDDNRLEVHGGTGDFDGVAGKVIVAPYPGPRDDLLEFHLVQ